MIILLGSAKTILPTKTMKIPAELAWGRGLGGLHLSSSGGHIRQQVLSANKYQISDIKYHLQIPSSPTLSSVTLPHFHCVSVSGPLQSARRPRDVIYFMKAMTNSWFPGSRCLVDILSRCIVEFLLAHGANPNACDYEVVLFWCSSTDDGADDEHQYDGGGWWWWCLAGPHCCTLGGCLRPARPLGGGDWLNQCTMGKLKNGVKIVNFDKSFLLGCCWPKSSKFCTKFPQLPKNPNIHKYLTNEKKWTNEEKMKINLVGFTQAKIKSQKNLSTKEFASTK